jgi:hypothetical protein
MRKHLSFLSAVLICASVAFAQFEDDDEWSDFDYSHAGLSQSEFQKVKESGMSKEKLLHLLEIGIRPSAYLKEPWKDLGVSESEWLSERASGMSDADIDRTYKNKSGDQGMAYMSFLLPSYYQWKTDQMGKAIAIDIGYAAAWGLTYLLYANSDGGENLWAYGLIFVGAVHLYSGLDAVISTLWDNNPDAKGFSWGIAPTGKGVAGAAVFRF